MPFVPSTSIARSSGRLVPCSRYASSTILLLPVLDGITIADKRFKGTNSSGRPSKRRVDAIIRPEWHPARTRSEFRAHKTSSVGMTPEQIRAAFPAVPIREQGVPQTEAEWRGAARTSIDKGRTVTGNRVQRTHPSTERRGDYVRQPEWRSIPSTSRFKTPNEHGKDRFMENTRTSKYVPQRGNKV
jgi:hypothetical protein